MNKLILSLLLTICLQNVIAQVTKDTTSGGAAVIIKDTRIAVLEKKNIEKYTDIERAHTNKPVLGKTVITRTSSSGIVLAPGYRLMVISTPDVNLAMKVRSNLLKYVPGHKPYTIFQMPNTKLQYGNFLNRAEADQVRKKILALKIVPGNVFIINANVEMKVKKSEETSTVDDKKDATKEKTKKDKKPTKATKPVKPAK